MPKSSTEEQGGEGTLLKAHCITKAGINCELAAWVTLTTRQPGAFPAERGCERTLAFYWARGREKVNMANNSPHWLDTPLAPRALGIPGERAFKQEVGEACSLALALGARSWPPWLMELWLGNFGCRWTRMPWISGPCSLHGWVHSWDQEMPGIQATHGRKPEPGGRVPHWDTCLAGLQPLGLHDPVQPSTRVPDCYMVTENSAPQILRESCFKRMAILRPMSALSREGGNLFAQPA